MMYAELVEFFYYLLISFFGQLLLSARIPQFLFQIFEFDMLSYMHIFSGYEPT